MTHESSTQELVAQAQAGDRVAFEALVDRHRDGLRRFIASRLGRRLRKAVDADDVLQETVLKALSSLERFTWRGEKSFFRWLAGIANNLIRNLARRERPTERISLAGELAAAADSPSKGARREERLDRFSDALGSLTEEHRRVIRWTRIEGLSIREVAARLERVQGDRYQSLPRRTERCSSERSWVNSARADLGGPISGS